MGRRRERASDAEAAMEGMYRLFRATPWYVGPICAGLVYVCLAWGVPWWIPPLKEGDSLQNRKPAEFILAPLGLIAQGAAPVVAGIVIVIWLVAQAVSFIDRNRLDQVRDHRSIRELDWQEFERLLCEVFRRQGYGVEHSGRAAADGGVDIRLRKGTERSLVQCKHWKAWQVGVPVIREMLGLVTSEGANWGVVVTSGKFTTDAIEFANRNSVQLIDGEELSRLISSVQAAKPAPEIPVTEPHSTVDSLACPACGSPMVVRTAKRGADAGSQFYGCSRFPACKGTRPA